MALKETKIWILATIIALSTAAAIIAYNTPTEASDTSKYLPPEFKPEVISSVNKVSSIISTDSFINSLLSDPKMKRIIREINLDTEALKELLVNKTGIVLLYTNTSEGPVYIIRLIVGKLEGNEVAKPLNNFRINGTNIAKSYIIDIKLKLKNDNTASIIDISIEKNPLTNINYGPYPSHLSDNAMCQECDQP